MHIFSKYYIGLNFNQATNNFSIQYITCLISEKQQCIVDFQEEKLKKGLLLSSKLNKNRKPKLYHEELFRFSVLTRE